MVPAFAKGDGVLHRQMWHLALPMILSNLTVPLLGIVDTAVMGHLPSPEYLGAVAIGSMIFSFLFWGFGFLRMGTVGITAQAHGQDDNNELRAILARALLLALGLSLPLLLAQAAIADLSFYLLHASEQVEDLARVYFDIRIWAAPAVLARYVLLGWFLGMQNARAPLYMLFVINGLNVVLDIVFVMYLGMTSDGVALATVIAEYVGVLLGIYLIIRELRLYQGQWIKSLILNATRFKRLLTVNYDIFIRTLVMIFCFAFFTAQGARYGDVILAANAVLMNFLMFLSFGLDGFAHAAEAMGGRAIGRRDQPAFMRVVKVTGQWSVLVALLYSGVYFLWGNVFISWMTDIAPVVQAATHYLPWLMLAPITGVWCYWLDGVFIAATRSRDMRNTMIASALCYLLVWYCFSDAGNHGLWLALNSFLAVRGISLGWVLMRTGKHIIHA